MRKIRQTELAAKLKGTSEPPHQLAISARQRTTYLPLLCCVAL